MVSVKEKEIILFLLRRKSILLKRSKKWKEKSIFKKLNNKVNVKTVVHLHAKCSKNTSSFTNSFNKLVQDTVFSQMSNLATYFKIDLRYGLLILERA